VTDFDEIVSAAFPDRRVVQCNLVAGQSTAAAGARAYVVLANPGGGSDRIVVLLRSRSGRWIEMWQDIRTLGNFRVKTIPAGHPLYGHDRLWPDEPEQLVERLTAARARELGRGDGTRGGT